MADLTLSLMEPADAAAVGVDPGLFAGCRFIETTRKAHPGYDELTFVHMERRLNYA